VGSYTYMRQPVELVWSEHFPHINEATEAERELKG
jgi:predicted GIY-YIG superfamily endonuclease